MADVYGVVAADHQTPGRQGASRASGPCAVQCAHPAHGRRVELAICVLLYFRQDSKRSLLAAALLPDQRSSLFGADQVMPFIYTQLVSLACTIFLVASAFLKGVHFTPKQSYTFGIIVPAFNVALTTITVFGLLEVADAPSPGPKHHHAITGP